MTPREHLDLAIEQLTECAAEGSQFANKIVVEREGQPIAIAVGWHPGDAPPIAAMLLGAYHAEAVAIVADTWIYEGKAPLKGRSPSQLFRDGVPGASEAISLQYMTADNAQYLQANYVRKDKEITVTKTVDELADMQLTGRMVPKQELISEGIRMGRAVRMLLAGEGALNRSVADAIVTVAVGEKLKDHAEVMCFIPLQRDEVAQFKAKCAELGLDASVRP